MYDLSLFVSIKLRNHPQAAQRDDGECRRYERLFSMTKRISLFLNWTEAKLEAP